MDFEQQARMTKARKIADYCRTKGIGAAVLTSVDLDRRGRDDLRTIVCRDAGVKPASAETWAVVIGLLGAHEAVTAPDDPFDGLPSYAQDRPVRTSRPTSTGRPREDER